MSKEQYIDTFSNIHPSNEAIERIMNMTSKKHFTSIKKTIIVLAAIISIICSIGFVANAESDGSVTEKVSQVLESISNKITVLINGEETQVDINVTEKTNAEGEKYYEAQVDVDIPEDNAEIEYEFQLDDADSDLESVVVNSIAEYSSQSNDTSDSK